MAVNAAAVVRVYFPFIAASATCTAPVRLMKSALVAPGGDALPDGSYLGFANAVVTIDGATVDAQLSHTTGRPKLDADLVTSARMSRFWPALHGGMPVAGVYGFPIVWRSQAGVVTELGPETRALPAGC